MCLVPLDDLSLFFFTATVMDECEILHNKYDKCCHSRDFHRSDCTVVLNNSANVHVIGQKRVFIDGVKSCPIGMDVGTVTGSNDPQCIGTAQFCWLENDGHSHFHNLEDSLYYPSSLVNFVGVTKLATNNNDHSMRIKTFASTFNFSWNHDQHSMCFKHRPENLPEFPILWSKTSSFDLGTSASKDQDNNLTPGDMANLFGAL